MKSETLSAADPLWYPRGNLRRMAGGTETSHRRSVGCGEAARAPAPPRTRGSSSFAPPLSVVAMALATGLGVVLLSPGSAATVPWHKANFGNALVQNLCRSKRQSMFCWEPHFWTEPVYINGKGEGEPRATTGKYSEFWAANGPSMRSQIPPMPGPDEGEELPDLAIHLRCGDITTAKDERLYRYPCRSCITESIRPWLKEGWDNATSTAWFIVGGHPSYRADKEEADEAVRRCNDCTCAQNGLVLHALLCHCQC